MYFILISSFIILFILCCYISVSYTICNKLSICWLCSFEFSYSVVLLSLKFVSFFSIIQFYFISSFLIHSFLIVTEVFILRAAFVSSPPLSFCNPHFMYSLANYQHILCFYPIFRDNVVIT